MYFYRLIKPLWGQKFLYDGEEKVQNPDFKEEILGRNVIEGVFDDEFIHEKNEEGYNVYWFPNHPSTDVYSKEKQYLNGRDIDVFDYIFVDMDLKDKVYATKEDFYDFLSKFPLKPTMTFFSGNGVHAYWRVKDLTRDAYLELQMRLIQHFKTDDSIWTVLQLMRWPESLNTKKHGEFKPVACNEELSTGVEYHVKDFSEALPPILVEKRNKIQSHMDKLDGKILVNVASDVNLDELPDRFIDILQRTVKTKEEIRIEGLFLNPKEFSDKKDRSSADASLANLLFGEPYLFNIKELFGVLCNTQKALSKGANRTTYAEGTLKFVFDSRLTQEREENNIPKSFQTVAEKKKDQKRSQKGERVYGPEFFDATHRGWRKGNVMGLIAGTGVGKTSVALKCFKDMIKNNPENDDLFIFFSLEMPEEEIEERWEALVGSKPEYLNRLYVIGNEDENGEARNMTLQDIYSCVRDIKRTTGKKVASVVIDHVGIVNPLIDLFRSPDFGARGDAENGRGRHRVLTTSFLYKSMKQLAKMLDTFLIVLTQTTKEKGSGYQAIGVDGAYGSASYEWMMDFVMTVWQPLMLIEKDTDLKVLAWQYPKIRSKHKLDKVTKYQRNLLHYDLDTGDMRPLTFEEKVEFDDLLPIANQVAKDVEKKQGNSYSNSLTLEELSKKVSYDRPEA